MLFPSLDKRNTRNKVEGLCVTSERHIGELGADALAESIADRTRGNSLFPLNRSEAASSNSRPSTTRIYTARPALDRSITARGVYRKKGNEVRP